MVVDVAGFEIEAEIGRGGFGVVYRARQVAFDRAAAVKVLLPGTSGDELTRLFARECRAVGALPAHPNIVSVYSSGTTTAGMPYLAMQYLAGGSLADRVPLPADTVTGLGIRLADALGVAHAGGVIHRDVKPANILFADGGSTEPVLVDFGISALVGDGSTTSTDLALSVAYASPEILRGERATVSADVYALGATLYTAATGRTPFANPDGLTPVATLATRILTQPVADLRVPAIPAPLFAVVERCMAKDPAHRYATMAEVRAALEDAAAGVVPDRPRRSRRPLLAAAVAAALLAGVVTIGAVASDGEDTPSTPVADRGSEHSVATTGSGSDTPTTAPPTSGLTGADVAGAPAPPAGAVTAAAPSSVVVVPAPHRSKHKTAHTPTRTVTAAGTTVTAAPPAHAPVLAAIPALSAPEQYAVSTRVKATDADGGPLTYRVTGLPRGLTAKSNGTIAGTISDLATTVTTSYSSIRSKTFALTVTVTDSTGLSDVAHKTWTVHDTRFAMPNYVGYRGCNGTGSCHEPVRNLTQLGPHVTRCRVTKVASQVGRIVAQGTKPGTYTKYGYRFLYYVGKKSC